MRRKNRSDIFAEACSRSNYDEYPILEAGIDPQLHLSVNRMPQPFFLICEQDTVVAQMSGSSRVEFRNASVNYFDTQPGDFVYVPGGTAHRIIPHEPSIQLRYKADKPGLEAVAWVSPEGAETARVVWDCAAELPQLAYLRACNQFNADVRMRTCPRTGMVLPLIDIDAFGWRRSAEDILEALSEEVAPKPSQNADELRSDREFRPPRTMTEPLRVNVYEFARAAPAALTPIFPYLGPGCIVPCTTLHDTLHAGPMGYFLHENTVHEVNVCFGARSNFRKAGAVFVGPHHHGVGQKPQPPKSKGEATTQSDRPDMISISVITQRQSVDKPQREAMSLVCENCEAVLVRHPYDAYAMPEAVEGAWNEAILGLPTLSQDAWLTERFNSNISLRTCQKCSHVNPEFPTDYWGWSIYRSRTRAVVSVRNLLVEAAQAALTGTAAARDEPATSRLREAPEPISSSTLGEVSQEVIWREVANEAQFSGGSVIDVIVDDINLAIYKMSDGYWATEGICTHAFAKLAEGYLEGDCIECPYHGGSFDVRSGHALTAPCVVDLKTFPVKLDGNRIFIGLPKE